MAERRGLIAETNLATDATLSGGVWSEDLPLGNLKTIRLVSEPARVADNSDLADSQFECDLGRSYPISVIALLGTTLDVAARIRLTLAEDATFSAVVQTVGWQDCFPALYATTQLEWEFDNWWTGQPEQADIDLYGGNVIVVLQTPVTCGALRVELDDTTNAGETDIGHLFVARALPMEFNFAWGSEKAVAARSVVDEMPSGAEVIERRRSRRTLSLSYGFLTEDEQARLADIAQRNGYQAPLIVVPDPGRPGAFFREVFLGRMAELPAVTVREEGGAATLTLTEVIA